MDVLSKSGHFINWCSVPLWQDNFASVSTGVSEWSPLPPIAPGNKTKSSYSLFYLSPFFVRFFGLVKTYRSVGDQKYFSHRLEPLIFFNLYFGLESLGEGWEFTSLVYSFTWTAKEFIGPHGMMDLVLAACSFSKHYRLAICVITCHPSVRLHPPIDLLSSNFQKSMFSFLLT